MHSGRTYSANFIQVVFAVSGRQKLISPEWEEELYKYISGIINKHKCKSIAINGMPDHIHILFKLAPDERISDLVREIKKSSAKFIQNKLRYREVFLWQRGYASISYHSRDVGMITGYILNQKEHHKIVSLDDEVDLMSYL